MIPFEEYKERYEAIYDIHDEELLKLAYLIDCRLEEAKGTVGSANKGVGYWIAEKLMWEGYHDTKALSAVLKEATYEAIKRMNEDLGKGFIPIPIQDIVAPFGKSGSIIDLDKALEKREAERVMAVKEYLSQRDKETARKIFAKCKEKCMFEGYPCGIGYTELVEVFKDFGVEVEE